MMNAADIKVKNNLLNILTFRFEEDVPSLYNEFKNKEKNTNERKILHSEKLFTILGKLSKAYFGFANIFQKNLTIKLNFWYGQFLFVKWKTEHTIIWFINQLITT